MSTTKTALVSILIACWIVGLLNQFHAWDSVLRYLILSLLIAAIVALKAEKQFAKSRISKRR